MAPRSREGAAIQGVREGTHSSFAPYHCRPSSEFASRMKMDLERLAIEFKNFLNTRGT